jgi:hypothetical protein
MMDDERIGRKSVEDRCHSLTLSTRQKWQTDDHLRHKSFVSTERVFLSYIDRWKGELQTKKIQCGEEEAAKQWVRTVSTWIETKKKSIPLVPPIDSSEVHENTNTSPHKSFSARFWFSGDLSPKRFLARMSPRHIPLAPFLLSVRSKTHIQKNTHTHMTESRRPTRTEERNETAGENNCTVVICRSINQSIDIHFVHGIYSIYFGQGVLTGYFWFPTIPNRERGCLFSPGHASCTGRRKSFNLPTCRTPSLKGFLYIYRTIDPYLLIYAGRTILQKFRIRSQDPRFYGHAPYCSLIQMHKQRHISQIHFFFRSRAGRWWRCLDTRSGIFSLQDQTSGQRLVPRYIYATNIPTVLYYYRIYQHGARTIGDTRRPKALAGIDVGLIE